MPTCYCLLNVTVCKCICLDLLYLDEIMQIIIEIFYSDFYNYVYNYVHADKFVKIT